MTLKTNKGANMQGNTNFVNPTQADTTEQQKRWLSWNVLSGARAIATRQFGVKHSYAGTVTPETIAKRRAKDKAAKASRKANRG
jgi:hypothetical protein